MNNYRRNPRITPLHRITSAFVAGLMMVFPFAGFAGSGNLPTDPNIVHGDVSINTVGPNMHINQASQRAIVDWQTFNIGAQNALWIHGKVSPRHSPLTTRR